MPFLTEISTCSKAPTYFVSTWTAPPRASEPKASNLIPLHIVHHPRLVG